MSTSVSKFHNACIVELEQMLKTDILCEQTRVSIPNNKTPCWSTNYRGSEKWSWLIIIEVKNGAALLIVEANNII